MPLPLSAGDMTRLRRLHGGKRYLKESANNKDITNVSLPTSGNLPFPLTRDVGSSRIRRESSKWIDYIASQTANVVYMKEIVGCVPERMSVRICDCKSTVLNTKVTGCLKCNPAQHLRM